MVVLSDNEIKKYFKKSLEILPLDEKSITSNGYDFLTEPFEILPGEFKLIKSTEKISMPKKLISIPFLRTTYAFKGLVLSPGIIDSGFKGNLSFGIFNSSKSKISISHNERIIHLAFLELGEEAKFPFGTRDGEVNKF